MARFRFSVKTFLYCTLRFFPALQKIFPSRIEPPTVKGYPRGEESDARGSRANNLMHENDSVLRPMEGSRVDADFAVPPLVASTGQSRI
ncbi:MULTISPECIES: hypothetical protein [Paraburkholderia]|uniref:Uncharacterized protein n=1 Tax=Paraburkholderia podalyriae TaxID=1938811 RepID=A0ABR7PQP7_9BURK|nr:hypothetical protein [Paraburkholderia podalyriae]MBC8748584.1 hypothetical protein [Paraburkholderia podalyriae]